MGNKAFVFLGITGLLFFGAWAWQYSTTDERGSQDARIEQLMTRVASLEAVVKDMQRAEELPIIVGDNLAPVHPPGVESSDLASPEPGPASSLAKVTSGVPEPEPDESMSMIRLKGINAIVSDNAVVLKFTGSVRQSDAGLVDVVVNGAPVSTPTASVDPIENTLRLHLPPNTLFKGARVSVSWDELRDTEGKPLVGQSRALIAE